MCRLMTGDASKVSPTVGWWVYILRCSDDTLYTGISNDLQARVARHNAGRAARYTRSRLPVRLVYQEPAATRGLALRREHAIRKLSAGEKRAMIEVDGGEP